MLFYRSCTKAVVIFDEVHQLSDPSRILEIGADTFPHLKILATSSSTLAARKKFRDTLTGRKRVVHLVPVTWDELPTFGNIPITQRLFHGGLPPALLADTKPLGFYREWMDSFFAHDKAGREVDFVLAHSRDRVDAIECKWDPRSFDSAALQTFRSYYPKARTSLSLHPPIPVTPGNLAASKSASAPLQNFTPASAIFSKPVSLGASFRLKIVCNNSRNFS